MSRACSSWVNPERLPGAMRPMALSARCSSPNTPVAPSSKVAMPISAAFRPPGSCQAVAIMASIACAAVAPTVPSISATIWPRAASGPNTAPAMAIVTTSSGAMANIV